MRKTQLILTAFILTLAACTSWLPAGFWTGFDKEHQVEKLSDQGPWGGTRIIHWKADKGETFSTKEIVRFAEENGWTLETDTFLTADIVSKWTYSSKPIFPIEWTGFHIEMTPVSNKFEDFPRWTSGDIRVLSFTTDYIIVEPGSGEVYRVNGYALINSGRTELTVYHMWGE